MIEIRDLKAGYGSKNILDIPALAFRSGCITAVLGRNGSGKSTLLRSAAGILRYGGSITVNGEEIKCLSKPQRARKIAYLPQFLPIPEMDVYTLVSHGRFSRLGFSKRLGEEDRVKLRQAMELADIWHKRDDPVRSLSGGERQRAYLAMVIAQDTDFLLLDEPGAGMDAAHQLTMADILRCLADSGRGIVMSSHDLPFSFSKSDRVCLIKDGKAVTEGEAASVAARRDLLTDAMGAAVAPAGSGEGVYPFVLTV